MYIFSVYQSCDAKRKENSCKFNGLTEFKHWMMSDKFDGKYDDRKMRLSKMPTATTKEYGCQNDDRNYERHILSIVLCIILTSNFKQMCSIGNITCFCVIWHKKQSWQSQIQCTDGLFRFYGVRHIWQKKMTIETIFINCLFPINRYKYIDLIFSTNVHRYHI